MSINTLNHICLSLCLVSISHLIEVAEAFTILQTPSETGHVDLVRVGGTKGKNLNIDELQDTKDYVEGLKLSKTSNSFADNLTSSSSGNSETSTVYPNSFTNV
jgi:hypothetical protein